MEVEYGLTAIRPRIHNDPIPTFEDAFPTSDLTGNHKHVSNQRQVFLQQFI
jgi:hypothetical protein